MYLHGWKGFGLRKQPKNSLRAVEVFVVTENIIHNFKMKKSLLLIIIYAFAACSSREFESVVIKGSDTEVNLALDLSETFMETDEVISIAVTGGGSGSGIAALINRKCDIANSSREFKSSEKELAEERGIEVIPIIFATDALAFITHPGVGVDSLTVAQVGAIYRGEVTNWKELSGNDLPISLYGRQGNSGTFSFVQEKILQGEYSNQMKQMNGTAQILEAVKTDQSGIGYVGIGYIVDEHGKQTEGIKVLAIKENDAATAVSPANIQAIIEGKYVVTRPLYQYINGKPKGKLKEFIQFELSEAGQAIVKRNGYFPVTPKDIELNTIQGIYE